MASDKACRWFGCDAAEMRPICWNQEPPRDLQKQCPYAKAGNYSECPDYCDPASQGQPDPNFEVSFHERCEGLRDPHGDSRVGPGDEPWREGEVEF